MAHIHASPSSSLVASDHVEQTLDEFFLTSIDAAERISPYYASLWQHMRRVVSTGGKRLRPRMALLSYTAFGGSRTESMVPIAAALELLHASLLMHDDIIDRDYTRYGVSNVAGGYRHAYEQLLEDEVERTHFANSAALLGGDLLLSGAYQMIAQSALSNEDRMMAQHLLTEAIFQVAGGELLDTESSFREFGAIPAELVAVYKTASYTFVTPLLVGATLAGITGEQKVFLRIFAENLGVAFQLQDDLLGVFGNSNQTGKSTVGDLREGKKTYMVEQFCVLADEQQKEYFFRYFGQETLTVAQADQLRTQLIESGAMQQTEDAIAAYVHRAQQALSELHVSESHRQQFIELIDKAVKRSK